MKKIRQTTEKLSNLEQALIHHLLGNKDAVDKVTGGLQRIKALSLSIDFRNEKQPMILVQIGMLEAAFDALTGYKERGSCYGIERIIVDWLQRPSIKEEIKLFIFLKANKKG